MRAPAESAERRLESGPERTGKGVKTQKDVKLEGTNSTSALESAKVSKNELKTNWYFGPNEPQFKPRNGTKSNI
jgi:hypothetical protein